MFCSQCGNKLPDGAKFCGRCGQRVLKAPVPEPVYEEPAPEPVYEEPAPEPAYEEPAPEPAYEEPAPEPAYEEPAPEPAYEEPAPEPVYEEPAPEKTRPESLFSHPTFETMKAPEPAYEEPVPAAPVFVPAAPVSEEPIPRESAYAAPAYGAGYEKRAPEPEPVAYRRTAYEPTYEEPVDQPAFLPEKEPEIPQENRALSPWAYFGYSLLFAIPVIGWILLIVFSFAPKNVNLKNFTRSYWLWAIVLLAIALIALILIMTGVLKGPIETAIAWLRETGLNWVGKHLGQ